MHYTYWQHYENAVNEQGSDETIMKTNAEGSEFDVKTGNWRQSVRENKKNDRYWFSSS